MNLTGNRSKSLVQPLSRLFGGLAAMIVLLAGSGCTGTQNIRKAKPMPVNVPDNVEIVASEPSAGSQADVEVAEATPAAPAPAQEDEVTSPEEEILAAVTGGEKGVEEALQQTRGAVFASLTTPAGVGPPASVVKTTEASASGEGLQDSTTELTGDVEGSIDTEGAEPGDATASDDPVAEEDPESAEEGVVAQEEESSIAESSPTPEPVAPQEQEAVESPAVEAVRVAPPPEPEPAPVSEELAEKGLTTHDPAGAEAEGGTQSKTASVLFLILGGVGATLI